MNALAYATTEDPRKFGRYLAELRRSNAAGPHEHRATKRARGRKVEKNRAIREQL